MPAGLSYGQLLTPAQWNTLFDGKADLTGATFTGAVVFNGNVNSAFGYQQAGVTVLTSPLRNVYVGQYAGAALLAQSPFADDETVAIGYRALLSQTTTTAQNTAIGWQSMAFQTTGTFNTAVGVNTLGANVTRSHNVAVGTDAMRDTTGAGDSVAVGTAAMRDGNFSFSVAIGTSALAGILSGTTSGSSNIAIGHQSLFGASAATINNMIAIGPNTGFAITTGTNDVIIGLSAGQNSTTLSNSIAIGTLAMQNYNGGFSVGIGVNALIGAAGGGTTGTDNIAIGYSALGSTAAAAGMTRNVMIGSNSGASATAPTDNVAIGYDAGLSLTTGAGNAFIGSLSGFSLTSAYESTFIGTQSGLNATSNGNTLIGYFAGQAITSGSGYSTVIGNRAGLKLTTGDGNTVIGTFVASTTLVTGRHNIIIGVDANADTAAAGTSDSLVIQGAGTTPVISATGINSATPTLTLRGAQVLTELRTAASYATDAAAAAAGVALGQLYRNGSAVQIRVA